MRRESAMYVFLGVITATKNRLLALPSRLMHPLVGRTEPREIYALIDAEIRRALTELTNTDPETLLRDRTQQRLKRSNSNSDDD